MQLFNSDILTKKREALGLTQEELADKLKVSRQQVIRWESGNTMPRVAQIEKMCSILKCEPGELFFIRHTFQDREEPKSSMDLSKEVWIPVKGEVYATPFRISVGAPLGHILGKPGEQNRFALKVKGESMLPIYKPGIFIICMPETATLSACSDDESAYVPYEAMAGYNGRDAVVMHDGDTMLKRINVVRTKGPKYDLSMISLNPDKKTFPDVKLHLGDDWNLQAVVKRTDEDPEFLK